MRNIVRVVEKDGTVWQIGHPWPKMPGAEVVPANVGSIFRIQGCITDEGDTIEAGVEIVGVPHKGSEWHSNGQAPGEFVPFDQVKRFGYMERAQDMAEHVKRRLMEISGGDLPMEATQAANAPGAAAAAAPNGTGSA